MNAIKDKYFPYRKTVFYHGFVCRVIGHTSVSPEFRRITHRIQAIDEPSIVFEASGMFIQEHPNQVKLPGLSWIKTAHNTDCHEQLGNSIAQLKEWQEKYPNYCPACGGQPVTYIPQTHEEPESVDVCHICEDNGLCPRCGQVLDPSWKKPCQSCGFNHGKNMDDFPPEIDETICMVDEVSQYEIQ